MWIFQHSSWYWFVGVYFTGECIQVFLRITLTQPGDKGVKFSNFLYCSKVKNCRGKMKVNELTPLHTYTTMYTQGHTLLKAATLKNSWGKHGFWWALYQLNKHMELNCIVHFTCNLKCRCNAHSQIETVSLFHLSRGQNASAGILICVLICFNSSLQTFLTISQLFTV